jgi:hypothetical protein
MAEPYLTVVIPTRNDTYPSNVVAVQNKSLLILQRQLENARIESEIIVVEYNPDPSRPHLHECLRVDQGQYVSIRVICVDPEHHRTVPYHEKRVFHQTRAINIGLRRSRGRFFVYRAADHIYSDALVRFLSRKSLGENCIYRCDRCDIDRVGFDAVKPDHLDDVSRICEEHIVEWHKPLSPELSYRIPNLHINGSGDFLLMSRRLWMRLSGMREGRYPIFLDYDSLVLHAAYALCRWQTILPNSCRVYKLSHGMRTVGRIRNTWLPGWKKWDEKLLAAERTTLANLCRCIFNYPRRIDRTFEGVRLDAYERHFVLPAFLWAHGFPFVRQNWGTWGLGSQKLSETVLASAAWESSPE